MSLEKATVPSTTNQQGLSEQDIADAQATLGILKNLQEVIAGGNTYGNATQSFTFADNAIQFRDTDNDVGFNLSGGSLQFTNGAGNTGVNGGISSQSIFIKGLTGNFLGAIFGKFTGNHSYTLPDKSIEFAGLSDIPKKASTNNDLTDVVSVDITVSQSYLWNLTGNIDLTIDASNVNNNESYVSEFRITTANNTETLTLLNASDTKDVYGTYDPTAVNKLIISATKDGSGNLFLTYFFNQPN